VITDIREETVRVRPSIGRRVDAFNARVTALITSPRWGRLAGRTFLVLTYTGRRSGRSFSIPVGYRRVGTTIVIGAKMPEKKNWWRNFLGAGAPLSLRLDGADRPGHAVAVRDVRGRVTVTVTLT
jgi:hypothetical protein